MGHFARLGSRLYGAVGQEQGPYLLTCIDWETGRTLYEDDTVRDAAIIAAEGLLYVYEQRGGKVSLIKPGETGVEVSGSFRVTKGEGPHFAHPAISNGRLYLRHGDYLCVYDVKDKASAS
jgi:hypothetical protein